MNISRRSARLAGARHVPGTGLLKVVLRWDPDSFAPQGRWQSRIFQRAFEAGVAGMRADRGRRDVLAAEQALKKAKIDAVLKEQCRAGVAKHVRRQPP